MGDLVEFDFRGRPYLAPAGLYYDDETEIRERYWRIQSGDTVLDVGAGFGAYTLPALAQGARVYAIDSNRQTLDGLLETVRLNGFTGVTTLCMAIYDGATHLPLALKRQHTQSAHSPPRRVHWATLDGLVAGGVIQGRVDWVKVDVEGAELGVLRGGKRMLERQHPQLIIEDHSRVYEWVRRMRIASGITDLLHELGYRIQWVPYAEDGTMPRDYLIAT